LYIIQDKFNMDELCNNCTNISCCTGFDAPFLFKNDLTRLKKIGKEEDEYVEDIIVSGLSVKSLKKKKNSTNCIFWDEKKKLCTIYEDRPFDCKMFPFDIMKINNEYVWIVFSCNPDSNWKWTEEYLQRLEDDPQFSEVMENIEIFHHTLETDFSKTHPLPYAVLRKVRCKKPLVRT